MQYNHATSNSAKYSHETSSTTPDQGTTRGNDKNTKKHHVQENQEASQVA